MLKAWLDGAFVPMPDAKISAFDAGFQHGIGLFETMAARHGRIFRGLEHMERMSESARLMERSRTALNFACSAACVARSLSLLFVTLRVVSV